MSAVNPLDVGLLDPFGKSEVCEKSLSFFSSSSLLMQLISLDSWENSAIQVGDGFRQQLGVGCALSHWVLYGYRSPLSIDCSVETNNTLSRNNYISDYKAS